MERWKAWARALKREVVALYIAYRDPRVPWFARLFAALVVAYALSPIDLIPDPIPFLGYLDDLLLVPLGVWLALRMIPPDVVAQARVEADDRLEEERPVSRVAAVAVAAVWVASAALVFYWLWNLLQS